MTCRLSLWFALCLAVIGLVPSSAFAELSLGQLKTKFEAALEEEQSGMAASVVKLRGGYVGALEKLKVTLGRGNKLEEATQVLHQIEVAKVDATPGEIPEGVDYRLKRLHATWLETHEKLQLASKESVAGLAEKYLTFLEERKEALTRAGKIREALVVAEEATRTRELEVVNDALSSRTIEGNSGLRGLRGVRVRGDAALLSKGAKATAPLFKERLIDGLTDETLYSSGDCPCLMIVELKKLSIVEKIEVRLWAGDPRQYTYTLEVSKNGKNWDMITDNSRVPSGGLQRSEFEARDVKFIRVTGLSNSLADNNQFHIVEIEAR